MPLRGLAVANDPVSRCVLDEQTASQLSFGRSVIVDTQALQRWPEQFFGFTFDHCGAALSQFPTGSQIHASPGYETKDGFEYDYSVHAELPQAPLSGPQPSIDNWDGFQSLEAAISQSVDPRNETLRIDPESIVVHHVNSVKFECLSLKVKHYLTELTEPREEDL